MSRGKTKSMTLVQIKKDSAIRRVDFMYSPPDEYPFALFYFTGSKIFNTIVRQRAVDLGYTLNEHGLSYFTKGVKGKKIDHEFPTEQSIMKFLGVKYKKPEERMDGRSVVLMTGDVSEPEPEPEPEPEKSPTSLDEEEMEEAEAALAALEIKETSSNKSLDEEEMEEAEAALAALEIKETSSNKSLDEEEMEEAEAALAALEVKSPKPVKAKKNLTLKKYHHRMLMI